MLADRLHDEFRAAGKLHRLVILGIGCIAGGFLFFILGTVLGALGAIHPIVPLLIGFALLAIGTFSLGVSGAGLPPARRPRPRAGTAACPKCGGVPEAVTAHGFAKCPACGTPFFLS